LTRLASCIDRGLDVVRASLTQVQAYVQDLQAVDRTLKPNDEITGEEREAQFILRRQEWEASVDPIYQHFAKMMSSFEPGLFVGGESADFPADNLDLERWFKRPKGHERRLHARLSHKNFTCLSNASNLLGQSAKSSSAS
jgi:hypothetical protein